MIKLKSLLLESKVSSYEEKKTLAPRHDRDDKVVGRFFDHPEFDGRVTVINGTYLPLDVHIEKMANDQGKQNHLVTITTKIPESILSVLKRALTK